MIVVFCGPSCSGKSTAADQIAAHFQGKIFSGKDYLRLAKNETEAWLRFKNMLTEAVKSPEILIYVITETDKVDELALIDGLFFIRFKATIDVLEERFFRRMHGKRNPSLSAMLKMQVQKWENVKTHLVIDTSNQTQQSVISQIEHLLDSASPK